MYLVGLALNGGAVGGGWGSAEGVKYTEIDNMLGSQSNSQHPDVSAMSQFVHLSNKPVKTQGEADRLKFNKLANLTIKLSNMAKAP